MPQSSPWPCKRHPLLHLLDQLASPIKRQQKRVFLLSQHNSILRPQCFGGCFHFPRLPSIGDFCHVRAIDMAIALTVLWIAFLTGNEFLGGKALFSRSPDFWVRVIDGNWHEGFTPEIRLCISLATVYGVDTGAYGSEHTAKFVARSHTLITLRLHDASVRSSTWDTDIRIACGITRLEYNVGSVPRVHSIPPAVQRYNRESNHLEYITSTVSFRRRYRYHRRHSTGSCQSSKDGLLQGKHFVNAKSKKDV